MTDVFWRQLLHKRALCIAIVLTLFCAAGADALPHQHDRKKSALQNEILVRFQKDVSQFRVSRFCFAKGWKVSRQGRYFRWNLIQFPQHLSLEEIHKSLDKEKIVEYWEPNFALHTESVVPDDPFFPQQWYLHNTGQTVYGLTGLTDADIDAPEAWETVTSGGDILVAILDSGVYTDHEDLSEGLWTNIAEIPGNGVDDDGNGYIDDFLGWDFVDHDNSPEPSGCHGAGLAGLISAIRDNSLGIAGLASNARLMNLKVADTLGTTVARTVEAIEYAIDKGAKIINFSFGGYDFSEIMRDAIARAEAAGILFVCSAGNGGSDSIGDLNEIEPHYPSDYDFPNIVAVTATDQKDKLALFANTGTTTVDIAAPGIYIYTLGCETPSDFDIAAGTSASAALTTGAAAIVAGHFPDSDYSTIKARLLNGADSLPVLMGGTVTGARLNAWKALEAIQLLPESNHHYHPNTNNLRTYTCRNSPVACKVIFDQLTETEAHYDHLYIVDVRGKQIDGNPFSGKALSGSRIVVPGDTVSIRLCSDGLNEYYGYKVAEIEPIYLESAHPYANNSVDSQTFAFPGKVVPGMAVYFNVLTETANDGDVIHIFDKSGEPVSGSPFLGSALSGRSVSVGGNTVQINLAANEGGAAYGYKVWRVLPVFLESEHDYQPNTDETKTFTFDGEPSGLEIIFDQETDLEDGRDFVHILDGTGQEIPESYPFGFTGKELAGRRILVPGNTVAVRLVTDDSVNRFGYRIVDISPVYLESLHPYANNIRISRSYTYPGGPANIFVTFNLLTSVEDGCDFIRIYDGDGVLIPDCPPKGYSGKGLAGRRLKVPGDTVIVELISDRLLNGYGFRIESIVCDSDGDGITDQEEIDQGTDPLVFDHVTIDLYQGMNLFAYPVGVPNNLSARELKDFLGCTKILCYDRDKNQYRDSDRENFPITDGEGYIVYMPCAGKRILFSGIPHRQGITIYEGANLAGFPGDMNDYDSFQAIVSLSQNGNHVSMQRFDPLQGRFQTASATDANPVGVRFPVHPGQACFIFSRQQVENWQPWEN